MVATILSGAYADTYHRLRAQIRKAEPRNKLRDNLFAAKERLREVGFSVPESMMDFAAAIGWPEKAVTAATRRVRPGRIVIPRDSGLEEDVNAVFTEKAGRMAERMAIDSSGRHGCAFVFVLMTANGPKLTARSAREASALVDRRTLEVTAALECIDAKTDLLYLHGMVLRIERGSDLKVTEVAPTPTGMVACVPYVWGQSLDRLFGRSRITRPIMDLSGMAIRTMLRAEVTAEHFSSPQRALLGARKSAFTDKEGRVRSGLEVTTGSVWGIPDFFDEETGEWRRAHLQQLAASSQQPHLEHMRMIASQMSAESSIPINQLGIIQDNPPSAEAIRILESDLVGLVQGELGSYGAARMRTARIVAHMLGDPWMQMSAADLDGMFRGAHAAFLNPGTVTPAAASDMAQKFIAAYPDLATEDTVMELWGFDESQLQRLQEAIRRRKGANELAGILAQAKNGTAPPP